MSLNMSGFIDDDFQSIPANQITISGSGYDVDGIWQDGAELSTPYKANIQPVSSKELNNLNIGGERIQDYRNIYVNSGDFGILASIGFWEFDANNVGDQRYKVIKSDIRAWRTYAKITVVLLDE